MSTSFFPFAQLEFTHAIGPPPGRYVLGDAPEDEAERAFGSADVLVVRTHGAPTAKRGLLRRNGRASTDGDAPREVPIVVATLVRATTPLADETAAASLLASWRDDAEQETFIGAVLRDLNRAIAAYRASAADPYVPDLSRSDPRSVRLGYGRAGEVFGGKWTKAIDVLLPALRIPRATRLMPQQGTAAALAGRGAPLEAEELLLNAVRDHEQGRHRAAAAGLHATIELLLGELSGEVLDGRAREALDEVIGRRAQAGELAKSAQRGPLSDADAILVAELSELVGGVVDRRRYAPLGF